MHPLPDSYNITTVWLDLDDTLIDFRRNAATALRRMFETEPLLQRLFPDPKSWIERYEHHNHLLWAAYSKAEISREYLRAQRFILPLTEAGLPRREATEASSRYDTLYLDMLAAEKEMIPGAFELLHSLRRLPGVRIGILSNGFKEVQYRKMDRAGVTPFIDLTVLSDDIGINKPDTRIFIHAMRQAGDTCPTRHLMIGDNPLTDIRGAIDAGWAAIWFHPPGTFPDTPCPDRAIEVTRLDRIMPLIGKRVIK